MRGSAISSLLTAYYGIPRRLAILRREQGELQARIALLETEAGGKPVMLTDFTIPGTTARYDGPVAHSNQVSNSTLSVFLKINRRLTREIAARRDELHECERKLDALSRFHGAMGDIIASLTEDDRALITMRHRDGASWKQIAIRLFEGANESQPRKTAAKICAKINTSLRGSCSFTRDVFGTVLGRF